MSLQIYGRISDLTVANDNNEKYFYGRAVCSALSLGDREGPIHLDICSPRSNRLRGFLSVMGIENDYLKPVIDSFENLTSLYCLDRSGNELFVLGMLAAHDFASFAEFVESHLSDDELRYSLTLPFYGFAADSKVTQSLRVDFKNKIQSNEHAFIPPTHDAFLAGKQYIFANDRASFLFCARKKGKFDSLERVLIRAIEDRDETYWPRGQDNEASLASTEMKEMPPDKKSQPKSRSGCVIFLLIPIAVLLAVFLQT